MSAARKPAAAALEPPLGQVAAATVQIGLRARTALSYLTAGAIIWFVARKIPLAAIAAAFAHARIGLFIATATLAFAGWFFGETLLFSRLFSYFHGRTTFRETLKANAVQYFLQIVNVAVASGALIVFLKQRKAVPWLAGACTLLFQALIDFQVMIAMALAGLVIAPEFPWPHAVCYLMATLGALWLIAWFWMRGRAPAWGPLRKLYDRPAMRAFREAKLSQFISLSLIRAAIFAFQGLALYFEMVAFRLHVPFMLTFALTPVILLASSLPLTPVGLGSEQAAMVLCFKGFAPAADLLTVSLAASASNLLFRMALGLCFPQTIMNFDENA